MKSICWWSVLALCAATNLEAQSDFAGTQSKRAGSSEYAVTERGPDHRIWTRTEEELGPSGQILTRMHSYVELATGMHYWEKGEWKETEEVIEQYPSGAVARRGPHKVIFAGNLATPGAIDFEAPDGKRLRSHIVGLSYFDTASGKSVLIAEVKDCEGKVMGNQVLYEDAFTDFKASVRYTYTRAGFEQDVIFVEQPPGPEVYDLDPATTRLQVLTEFLDAPQPEKQVAAVGERDQGRSDEFLSFGSVQIGLGTAFLEEARLAIGRRVGEAGIPVSKQWLKLDGRDVLVEEIPVAEVDAELQALPRNSEGAWNPVEGSLRHMVSKERRLPARRLAQRPEDKRPMQMAQGGRARGGLVMDYQATVSGNLTNYTFRGDTTYYLSGNASVYGTGVNFEGGAVLKYASNATLTVNAPVTWQGSAYRPVILTAKDDDTVGETISGSTGSPPVNGRYASSALYIPSGHAAVDIRHLRVNYASVGVSCQSTAAHEVWNAQFSRCGTVAFVTAYGSLSLHNALAQDAGTIVSSYNGSLRGEHVTLRRVGALFSGSPTSCAITNSLFVQVTNWGSGFSSINNATNTSEAGVFQAAGAGSNYLASGSAFRNLGTANLRADVLAELRGKTTWPPVVCSNQPIAGETTLAAQAQRDTDTLDLGYHYEPVDYVVSAVSLAAPLTLAEGVVVGVMGDSGLNLQAGAHVYSGGSPKTLNRVCFYGNVQESPSGSASAAFLRMDSAIGSTLRFRFTDFALRPGAAVSPVLSLSTGSGSGELSLRDCQLRGCKLALSPTGAGSSLTVALTNNLVEFSEVSLARSSGVPLTVYLLNNLFRSNAFTVAYTASASNPTWFIRDNLYHGTPQTYSPSSANVQVSYNAFTTGTANSLGSSPAYTVAADFVSGPLGSYYYAASGSGLFTLINADTARSPAAAGLYHHTVKTAVDTKEGTDTPAYVDIGYHYAAVNATTLPVDTDGDHMADYVEDANGDGDVDNSETDWQAASDPGLRVLITEPKRTTNQP